MKGVFVNRLGLHFVFTNGQYYVGINHYGGIQWTPCLPGLYDEATRHPHRNTEYPPKKQPFIMR